MYMIFDKKMNSYVVVCISIYTCRYGPWLNLTHYLTNSPNGSIVLVCVVVCLDKKLFTVMKIGIHNDIITELSITFSRPSIYTLY